MQRSLLEQARAGRRAALSALNARLGTGDRVVSIFEGSFPKRQAVPEFHSVRAAPAGTNLTARPRLVLMKNIAA